MPINNLNSVDFTQTDGQNAANRHTQVNNNAWEDWNLSAVVGARRVLCILKTGPAATVHGARTNNTAFNNYNAYPTTIIVASDSNGIIEVYSLTNQTWELHGYIPLL